MPGLSACFFMATPVRAEFDGSRIGWVNWLMAAGNLIELDPGPSGSVSHTAIDRQPTYIFSHSYVVLGPAAKPPKAYARYLPAT